MSQRSEEILQLPIEELIPLVGADELNVKSEQTVWELVLRWINHDPESRKDCIVDLMKNIRLGLLDTQFFLENIKDHPYVVGNDACRPIIIETLKFLYDLEMITQKDGEVPTPEIARPRVPHEILFAIGGWSGGSPTNYIETYDTRADRWIPVLSMAPLPPPSLTRFSRHIVYSVRITDPGIFLDRGNRSGQPTSLSRTRGNWLRHLRHRGFRRGRLFQQLSLLQRGDQGVAGGRSYERQKVEYISEGLVIAICYETRACIDEKKNLEILCSIFVKYLLSLFFTRLCGILIILRTRARANEIKTCILNESSQ